MHSGFQALRAACPMNLGKICAFKTYPEEVVQNVSRIEALWGEAREKFGRKANKPYLYGAFTAVDAMFAPVVTRLDTYQIPVEDTTRAYMDAVLAHPSVKAWRTGALAEPETWDLAKYEDGHKVVEVLPRTATPDAKH
jgi:glutathione S-transferase